MSETATVVQPEDREALFRQWWAEGVYVDEIGKRLGMTRESASRKARHLGLLPRAGGSGPQVEARKREAARAKAAATDEEIEGRLLAAATRELRKTTTKEILARIDDSIIRLLESLDDRSIFGVNPKDRMVAAAILIDKRQILSGQPTDILRIEERKSLLLLVPELVKEAARRGVTIEGRAVEVLPAAEG